jgi:antitoxin VapB
MSLYIRNEETCRLARELAALLGVTITEAIHIAVKERLERLKADPQSELAVKPVRARSDRSTTQPN